MSAFLTRKITPPAFCFERQHFKKGRRYYYQLILELNLKEKPKRGSHDCSRQVKNKTSEQIPRRLFESDAGFFFFFYFDKVVMLKHSRSFYCSEENATDGMNFSKTLPDDSRWLGTHDKKEKLARGGRTISKKKGLCDCGRAREFSGKFVRKR